MTIYSLDSFSYLELVCCYMYSSNCCFLTCKQISQESDKVVWYSHLLKNFLQFVVIHRVKGFGRVNKAEIDVFLELTCFFNDPVDVGNLMSGSSAFSKSSLNIWKFTVHILLKPGLQNFEHHLASVWDECNCQIYTPPMRQDGLLLFSPPRLLYDNSLCQGTPKAPPHFHYKGFFL